VVLERIRESGVLTEMLKVPTLLIIKSRDFCDNGNEI
jgi:hypothetical protein